MNDSVSTDRRTFINWFLGTTAGALLVSAAYPVFRYLSPPRVPEATTNQVDAGAVNDPTFLEKGFKIIRFGADPVIVIRMSEKEFRAFSATCTHLACIVEYEKKKTRIHCNCHGGVFDLTGRNVSGPPPKPLTPFKVNLVSKGSGQPDSVIVSRA